MKSLLAVAIASTAIACGCACNETSGFAFTRGMTVASESSDSAGKDAGFTTRFRSLKSAADVAADARKELTSAAGWTETTETGQLTLSSPPWTAYVFKKSSGGGNFQIRISDDPGGQAATFVTIRQRVNEDRML